MSNSSLATYFRQSPNWDRRTRPITKVTWHHMAGVNSVEGFGNIVSNTAREMSATYAIGSDARVGRYLDETTQRPWTSNNSDNDQNAVTIEISNSSMGGDWPISTAVFNKAIELTVDICKRNGIKQLTYTGNINGSLTFHCDVGRSATSCPGPYIKARAQEICKLVNAKLQPTASISTPTSATASSKVKAGSLVSIASGAVYYSGAAVPAWVRSQKWYVSEVSGNRAVLGFNEAKNNNINSPIDVKYLTPIGVVASATAIGVTSSIKSYQVQLRGTDKIYTDGTGTKSTGVIGGNGGVFTITAEQTTNGIKYGKLKSGAGWVKVSQTPKASTTTKPVSIKVGDTVKVLHNIQYNGNTFKIYNPTYKVLELKGDRAVISSDGKNVTCAINIKNIQKVG